jgi:hypothetical protein
MVCVNPEPPNDISVLERLANGFDHAPDLALVVDLPGGEAVRFALSLALHGFRPVPVIDGSPGPNFIAASADLFAETAPLSSLSAPSVDMREILRGLCAGAALLRTVTIPSYASPAFVLDANRMAGYQPDSSGSFRQPVEDISARLPIGAILAGARGPTSGPGAGTRGAASGRFVARSIALARGRNTTGSLRNERS